MTGAPSGVPCGWNRTNGHDNTFAGDAWSYGDSALGEIVAFDEGDRWIVFAHRPEAEDPCAVPVFATLTDPRRVDRLASALARGLHGPAQRDPDPAPCHSPGSRCLEAS